MPSKRILWPLFLATACLAQSPASTTPATEPNGVVTGRVFCGDTGLPARMASVSLIPVNPAKTTKKSSATRTKPTYTVTTSSVETALDGSYTLANVLPGVYYISVQEDGYINPSALLPPRPGTFPPDQADGPLNQAIQHVVVEQNSTVRADVQLQRGAAVSGTITYDDGSPASGITVAVLTKNEKGEWRGPLNVVFFSTNDRGYFRLNSLLPGIYILEANLNIGISRNFSVDYGPESGQTFSHRVFESAISFYGHGTPFIGQAPTFTLRGDEERTGQDMTLPISKLRKLSGRVAAGANGHFVNAATVQIISDNNKEAILSTAIEREDGLFHFEFVPEGDYTLRITNARDVTWETPEPSGIMPLPPGFPGSEKEHVVETYGNVDVPLILRGDMTGITATVPPNTPSTASN